MRLHAVAAVLLALAAAAAAEPSRPPSITKSFTALVNMTVPFFGKQPATFYYDALAESQRFDLVSFGAKSYQVQLFASKAQYNIVPGGRCDESALSGPFPDLSVPPSAVYKGSSTIRGVAVDEWQATLLGSSFTWWVHARGGDLSALLVRFATSGIVSSTIDFDPSTIRAEPVDPALFDVTKLSSKCPAPTPPPTFDVSGYVTDADSGRVVPGAVIKASTGQSSSASPYEIDGVRAGELTLTASASGYTTLQRTINVSSDVPPGTAGEFILSRSDLKNDSSWRFALTWGAYPTDLDTHFKTPSGRWIGPETGTSVGPPPHNDVVAGPIDGATLTRYDASSFGPETTLVENTAPGTRWEYWVTVDQSAGNTGDFEGSDAMVTVYQGSNGIVHQVRVAEATGLPDTLTWHVFDLDGDTLRVMNELTPWHA